MTRKLIGRKDGGHLFDCLFGATALLLTLALSATVGEAQAAQVRLAWDPNTEPTLAGYNLYQGTRSRTYTSKVDVGNVTSHTVTGLVDGQKYYFAVTAYDSAGNESRYSNEISYGGATVPEMQLLGNAVSIADGDSTPSAADHTDFGSAGVAGGTVTRTFTVQNTGSASLLLSGSPRVVVGGTHAADFTVTAQPAASVAAGASTTFQVRFDPSTAGARNATLSIANNDANENPYNFSIQGAGTAGSAYPEVSLVGNAVSIADGDSTPSAADHTDFGLGKVEGGIVSRTFTIQNTGSATLTLSGSPRVAVGGTHASDFTVTVLPASSVAPGGSTSFTVNFDASAGDLRTATLSIANNDPDENPYDFAIRGTGLPRPDAPSNVRADQ